MEKVKVLHVEEHRRLRLREVTKFLDLPKIVSVMFLFGLLTLF